MTPRIDAHQILIRLIGQPIKTFTGRVNTVLEVGDDYVLVGTKRSPNGERVPIESVQAAVNRILGEDEVEIGVPSLGYRSAFCGAVLLSLPGIVPQANPPRAIVADRHALEHRLFASLADFREILETAREQARKAGMKKSDVDAAIRTVRNAE